MVIPLIELITISTHPPPFLHIYRNDWSHPKYIKKQQEYPTSEKFLLAPRCCYSAEKNAKKGGDGYNPCLYLIYGLFC